MLRKRGVISKRMGRMGNMGAMGNLLPIIPIFPIIPTSELNPARSKAAAQYQPRWPIASPF